MLLHLRIAILQSLQVVLIERLEFHFPLPGKRDNYSVVDCGFKAVLSWDAPIRRGPRSLQHRVNFFRRGTGFAPVLLGRFRAPRYCFQVFLNQFFPNFRRKIAMSVRSQ